MTYYHFWWIHYLALEIVHELGSGKYKYTSDQDLLQALRTNQMDALDQIYAMYRKEFIQSAVYKFHMIPREDIIDAWQDTVISFYEQVRAGKLTSLSCSIKSFLFLIGYRYIIKYKRHYIKETSVENFLNIDPSEVSTQDFEWDDSWAKDSKLLGFVVQQLPEQSRKILVLRYIEGKSIDEIKVAMGYTSSNAISVSLSRSLAKLRELITKKN